MRRDDASISVASSRRNASRISFLDGERECETPRAPASTDLPRSSPSRFSLLMLILVGCCLLFSPRLRVGECTVARGKVCR